METRFCLVVAAGGFRLRPRRLRRCQSRHGSYQGSVGCNCAAEAAKPVDPKKAATAEVVVRGTLAPDALRMDGASALTSLRSSRPRLFNGRDIATRSRPRARPTRTRLPRRGLFLFLRRLQLGDWPWACSSFACKSADLAAASFTCACSLVDLLCLGSTRSAP